MTQIYWIKHKDHTCVLTQGYIGVTKNLKERIRHHFKSANGGYHSDKILSKAINKYGKEQIIVETLLFGDNEYCYEIEQKLRPNSFIGWNMKEGGYHTPNPNPKGSKLSKCIIEKAQNTLKQKRMTQSVGRDRKVCINGVIYNSIKSAREAHNISSTQMKRLLKGSKDGYKFGHLEVKYAIQTYR